MLKMAYNTINSKDVFLMLDFDELSRKLDSMQEKLKELGESL